MRKQLSLSFLVYFLLILSSCGDKIIITKYETGEKHESYQYIGDSLKHGWYKTYSRGGILTEESMYADGKLDGERKIYNADGILEVTEQYTMNALNGTFKTYHPNGKIKLEGVYTDNVLQGMVKGYFATGELKEEVMFANNMEEGPFKEYHKNGKPKWEGTYMNGNKEIGLLKEYNEQGELIKKMFCDSNAICTTTWTIDGSHLISEEKSR